MRRFCGVAAVAALLLCSAQVLGQSVTFDFEDGTDQGWGSAFGDGPDGNNDTDTDWPIVDIGGSKRMELMTGGFQAASIRSNGNPYLAAVNAGTANPDVSTISYDYYIDTSGGGFGTYLNLGTYLNSGQDPYSYVQSFAEVGLGQAELDSGEVLTGTVTGTFTGKYGALAADFLNAPFQRFGLIVQGDASPTVKVYFDNITITGVPEPASLALFGMAVPALLALRRRVRR